MTRIAGVIGDPVAHSRSPAMHNAAFAALGIDARYERWHTPAALLAERVAALRGDAMLGASVTLPYKLAVMPLLDRIDDEAARIGAVNTIAREDDGTLVGYNTDAPGFLASLRHDAGFEPAGKLAVVLGASGAARAAACALVGAGAAGLIIVNRTPERAEELLGDLLNSIPDDPFLLALAGDDPALTEHLSDASLIVNATSLGWNAHETPLNSSHIPAHALVYDMVYRPTRLLQDAAAKGAATCDGAGMLIHQAALAFTRWTQRAAPVDVMRAAFATD